MACVESAYVRRRLTYFSMTKCVFIGLLGRVFFVFPFGHLYRKRQTKPETELGSIAVVLGGVGGKGVWWWSHTWKISKTPFESYQRFGWTKRRSFRVPMTVMM
jgi:hypothetical protein